MDRICLICNGMEDISIHCNRCRVAMDHMGKIKDYLGPYSPYMDEYSYMYNNITYFSGDNRCIHIFSCPICRTMKYKTIPLEIM